MKFNYSVLLKRSGAPCYASFDLDEKKSGLTIKNAKDAYYCEFNLMQPTIHI